MDKSRQRAALDVLAPGNEANMRYRRSGSRVTGSNLRDRIVRRNRRLPLDSPVAWLCGLVLSVTCHAQLATASDASDGSRRTDRSAHFLLHTDLAAADAEALLQRMEATLQATMDYWHRPVQDLIECFVVDDLKHWPQDTLPHPLAPLVIERIGGVTLINEEGVGIQARKQVVIFADAKPGIAEHEVVHAYCGLVFGKTGPAWYREGIAQVFAYDQRQEQGLWCPPELMEELVDGPQKPLCKVLGMDEFNKQLVGSIAQKLDKQQNLAGLVPISDWSASDVRELDNVKKQYAWSWLACHLLYHSPNYRQRFRSLGQAYLSDGENRLPELLGPVVHQLAFEYEFTLERFAPGYRVDLCHWDWDKRFRLPGRHSARVRVAAARGYQGSGVIVHRQGQYQVTGTGSWQTGAHAPAVGIDGAPDGRGSLEGIVLDRQFQLSKPFRINADSPFQPPADGRLYLRCRDSWAELADNEGSIVVAIRPAR